MKKIIFIIPFISAIILSPLLIYFYVLWFLDNEYTQGEIVNISPDISFLNIDKDIFFFRSSNLYEMNLSTKNEIQIQTSIAEVQFSQNGRYMLLESYIKKIENKDNQSLYLYDVKNKQMEIIYTDERISNIEISPDSKYFTFEATHKVEEYVNESRLFIYSIEFKKAKEIRNDSDIIAILKWDKSGSNFSYFTLFRNNNFRYIIDISETVSLPDEFQIMNFENIHINQKISSNTYYRKAVSRDNTYSIYNDKGSLYYDSTDLHKILAEFDGNYSADFQIGIINPFFITDSVYTCRFNDYLYIGDTSKDIIGELTEGYIAFIFEPNYSEYWSDEYRHFY